MTDIPNYSGIVEQVKHQFPAFYKEQGPDFIMFVEAYYEWLEQDQSLGYARELFNITDIDETYTKFLENFKNKYMYNLPPELLGNQILLQKHILELYRAKGSDAGLKLLFRLIFNEDVEKYIPSYDIFKTSDNTWVEPHYIEVSSSPITSEYVGEYVYGVSTGASAVVESVEEKYVNGKTIHLLMISNIKGVFEIGERIVRSEADAITAPLVRGSVTELDVKASSASFAVGDIITASVGDKPIEAAVSTVYKGLGILDFTVVDGGSYYSLDANIIISAGSSTQGAGANAIVGSIKNTFDYTWNSDKLQPFANVALNSTFVFASNPTANLGTIIATCLNFETKTVGTIDTITVLNPGSNYDAPVAISVIDPYTSTSGIFDSNDKQVGANAIVTGVPLFGDGLISTVRVLSSGYSYQNFNNIIFFNSDKTKTATAKPVLTGVGYDYGYYDNTKSFLSDDKYLFDGHYYQDFSYVIRSSRTLDKYVEVLKQIYHPAGNAVYGDIKIIDRSNLTNDAISAGVTVI